MTKREKHERITSVAEPLGTHHRHMDPQLLASSRGNLMPEGIDLQLEQVIHTTKIMPRTQSTINNKLELVDRYPNFLPQDKITQANIFHHLPEVPSKIDWIPDGPQQKLLSNILVSFVCLHHFPIYLQAVSHPQIIIRC